MLLLNYRVGALSCLTTNKLFHYNNCVHVPSFIPEYTCSRQKLVVHPSPNQYHDPANPIIVASSSTTEVSKCVYWIDPQPVTISSQRGESRLVHGILKSVQYTCNIINVIIHIGLHTGVLLGSKK